MCAALGSAPHESHSPVRSPIPERVLLRVYGAGAARVAEVAGGVLQHLRDDARFHDTPAFSESVLAIVRLVRAVLPGDSGLRAGFLGHLLVEVLLDAALIAESPERLSEYYRLLDRTDAGLVQQSVNRFAVRPTVIIDGKAACTLRIAKTARRESMTAGTSSPPRCSRSCSASTTIPSARSATSAGSPSTPR